MNGQPGTCYQSSLLHTLFNGSEYVEGVLIADFPTKRISLPHAWNEVDGEVVDTTLLPAMVDARLTYVPVRRGTNLTIPELNDRGNPSDLVDLAAQTRGDVQ